ncbi:MAG: hypothetical protein KF903_12430 [Dokdonella sp.]|uniref:hypothetical protein n=1 Tax=Dokdonella sp. TaxID=2291710 RepID=UPI0025C0BBDF|nr:hypothetical protein [Dokdonella sp.]MBX3701788.1 hypothetical protein [Dokdonella sp.]MCW5578324.1 hypothetical protein [Dokdonella sp.]
MHSDAISIVPEHLRSFFTITEVDNAELPAGALFQRKFGSPPPTEGHHLVALHRAEDGGLRVAGYSHAREFGDVCLIGGACTDGAVMRALPPEHAAAIRAAGGVWYLLIKYMFARYADRCAAFFGYCGDPRALEVDLAAGFVPVAPQFLLAHWHRELPEIVRRALIAKVAALGPF